MPLYLTALNTRQGSAGHLIIVLPRDELVLRADAIGFLSGFVLVRYLFVTQLGGLLGNRGLHLGVFLGFLFFVCFFLLF